MTPRILLSIGDPNGVGPEIAAKAVAAMGEAAPILIGDRCAVDTVVAAQGLELRTVSGSMPARAGVCDLIDVDALSRGDLHPGKVTAEAGAATIAYATAAVRLAETGGFRGIVAGPHSETAVHRAGIPFAGYPRLLAELTHVNPDEVFLMLVGAGLRIAHATLHVSLAKALSSLTTRLVTTAGLALHAALDSMGIPAARLGVFGIDPHAGEGGLFGTADIEITTPAVQALRSKGIDALGPVGADVLLGERDCDGYLAMYHDQGHVPVKTLAGRRAAAVTIGAGVPFSSVGHGPAFDIVGTDTADPSAVLAALSLFTSRSH